MIQFKVIVLVSLAVLLFVSLCNSHPQEKAETGRLDDSIAAEGHHSAGHHYGRVQIKAYRGESKAHGDGWFAPYGYWVRQPADGWGGWGWH